MLSTGCVNETIDYIPVKDMVYFAETEYDVDTKTSLGEGNTLLWSASDEIVIFEKTSNPSRYILEDGDGETSGKFRCVTSGNGGASLSYNIGFYPYSDGIVCSNTAAPYILKNISLPARQEYVPNGFAAGAFPMTAISETEWLSFKNLCGAIKLKVKGTKAIKSVEIKGNAGELISGKANVTIYDDEQISKVNMQAGSSESVLLDCGKGVQLNAATTTDFIIVLPPTEFNSGFTVTLTDIDGGMMTVKATVKNVVKRSTLLRMPVISYVPEKSGKVLTECPFQKGINISDWLLYAEEENIRPEAYLEKDFIDIKNLGFDAVRLPVNFQNHVDASNKINNYMLTCLDNAVNMAEKVGLYIIIDNHGYLGKNFYDSDRLLMTSVFGQLAQRYSGRSDKLIYELFNEPHQNEYFKNTSSLNDVQNEWIAAIREYDTEHSIIVTGDGCSIDHLADCNFSDRNLIYTFHFYGPHLFTHQGADWNNSPLQYLASPVPFPYDSAKMPAKPSEFIGSYNEADFDDYPELGNVEYIRNRIQKAVDFANERNVPVFCGEWGVLNKLAEQDDYCYYHRAVKDIFENNGIAWTLWAYRDDFSIFNREGGYLVESNLNLGLLEALDLNIPEDYGSMFQSEIIFYDDYVATFAKPASFNYDYPVSFESTTSPYSGNKCIKWTVGGKYASVTCEIWPVIDLSVQAAKDYVLSFMIKTNDAISEPGLTVRFSEYDKTLANPIPWRYGVTVDNRSFASDGKWYEVRLPMSWFGNMGSNTESAVPSRPCDWKHINKLEFAAEGNTYLIGTQIYIDQVRLIDKAHIDTMDRIPKDESWWW